MTRVGPWTVWTATGGAPTAAAWVATVERLRTDGVSLHRSKHADTYRWTRPEGDVYVKVYRRYRHWTAFKDWFRPSKAENVRVVSATLTAAGFVVPQVLAVGDERGGWGARRSWCATAALVGEPVGDRLAALAAHLERTTLRAKRGILEAVGREAARLHAAGVVAGDLVPANVWIVLDAGEVRIAFLDHDRTRVDSGRPAPWRRARRNLVQLNRIVLRGVSAADRLRVYRAYAAERGWTRAEARGRLGWIIAKTVARRRAERGPGAPIASTVDFRTLMRADGPYAPRTR
jgi:hypothetical protein